uniref:Uncharacterized protein n=1 Tax=Rangifer tarandus platyrhynchus TaxID=3082113 RepID=A0ACB0ECI2_RANTA|nr:unnamed protein product [Rangifer tarandus platyrhynchus]
MDQRREPQTWTILRFLLPSQLRGKSTLSPRTGGDKIQFQAKRLRQTARAQCKKGGQVGKSREEKEIPKEKTRVVRPQSRPPEVSPQPGVCEP